MQERLPISGLQQVKSAWQALLRSRFQAGYNTLRFAASHQKRMWFMLGFGWGLLLAVLVWQIVYASRNVLSETVIEQIFFYVGLLMIVSAAPQVFGSLFQSGDVAWLLSAPVPVPTIVWVKILDSVLSGSRVFIPILTAAWLGVGLILGLSPAGWLISIPVWGLFTMFAAGFTTFMLLVSVVLLGARRVQNSLILFHVGVPIAMLITLMFTARNPRDLIRFENLPMPAFSRLLPSNWAAEALIGFNNNSPSHTLLGLALLLLVCLLMLLACALLGRYLFQQVELFEAASEAGSRIRVSAAEVISRPASLLKAVLQRDSLLIRRDPLILWQILTPLLLAPMPLVLLQRFPEQASSDELRFITFSLIVSMLYLQTSVVSLSSVGLDARAYWLVKSAPVSPLQYLVAKWLFAVLLCGGAMTILAWFFGLLLRVSPFYILSFWGLMLLSSCALSGIGVGLSAYFPRFVWDTPAQRVSVWSLMWGFGLYTAYIVLMSVIVGFTYLVAARGEIPTPVLDGSGLWVQGVAPLPAAVSAEWMVWLTGGLWAILLSAIATFVPLVMGAWRLQNYEWEH